MTTATNDTIDTTAKTAKTKPILLPYQQRINQTARTARLCVIEKGRRIGATWGLAAQAVLVAAAQNGCNVYYMSTSVTVARDEFIPAARRWAELMNIAAAVAEQSLVDAQGRAFKVGGIRFESGYSLWVLPSRAVSLRGREGWLILDEAAFHSDLDAILQAATSFTIWGKGRVTILSTHNGAANPFNYLARDVENGVRDGAHLRISFADAVSQGLYKKICAVQSTVWTIKAQEKWVAKIRSDHGAYAAQELDCLPSNLAGAWLSWDLIRACEAVTAGDRSAYKGGLVYIGVDIARRHDCFVLAVFENVDGILINRETIIRTAISFAEQDALIADAMKHYRVVRLAMDQTGMGEKMVEDAQRLYGGRVEGVLFTAPRKLDLATSLREHIEDRRILIPADPVIRADLHAIRRETNRTGHVRLVDGGGLHADIFWAYALAASIADRPAWLAAYDPVPVRHSLYADSDDDDENKDTGIIPKRWGKKRGW